MAVMDVLTLTEELLCFEEAFLILLVRTFEAVTRSLGAF